MALLQRGSAAAFPLISRASPDLWPRGAEISFCHTIDHCRTILYYTVLYLDLAPRRRYCRLFTLLYRPRQPPRAPDPDTQLLQQGLLSTLKLLEGHLLIKISVNNTSLRCGYAFQHLLRPWDKPVRLQSPQKASSKQEYFFRCTTRAQPRGIYPVVHLNIIDLTEILE